MEIAKVLHYEGESDVLVWKHPEQDFNTATQLIVHESQEAILFRDGQALDLFGPGKYTLETQNIPFLRKLVNAATDGETPFHCEVYFINKATCMDILWGTASPVPIQDPKYDIILPVRANGQFAVRVEDSRKFLVKIVGTATGADKNKLVNYFRGLLMTRIKDYIATLMIKKKISFLEIHSYLNEISGEIQEQIDRVFGEYGIKIANFFVNSISVPSDDPGFIKIRNALAAAKERELLAKGKKAEMDTIGYNYQQERTFDVLNKAAQNEGNAGNIMGLGMGFGMGIPVGGAVGQAMGDAMKAMESPAQPEKQAHVEKAAFCPECGAVLPSGAKFCMNCGHKLESVLKCPQCGVEIPAGCKFCPECGTKLKEE